MHKRMKFRAVVLIRRTAFVMALCMMLGSLRIPVLAEEKNDDLQDSFEKVNSDTSMENRPEGKPGENGKEEISGDDNSIGDNMEETEPGEGKDENTSGDDNIIGDGMEETKPEEDKKDIGQTTVSGNDIKGIDAEEIKEEEKNEEKNEEKEKSEEKQELLEIINVVVPTAYTLALNPYRLPVKIGEDAISTEQIISGMYGIVNKSSSDQIVTVSFMVEDCTEGKLLFVESAEEAQNAGKNVYAIYLAAVPANEEPILIDGQPVDSDISGEALQNVEMIGAQEQAVTLYAGINQAVFRLAGSIYELVSEEKAEMEENLPEEKVESDVDLPEEESEVEIDVGLPEEEAESDVSLSEEESEAGTEIVLTGLAPDGKSVTAYTFYGVMNPDAEWEKLQGGIRLSVVYTYQEADGSEEILDGTGAMISID